MKIDSLTITIPGSNGRPEKIEIKDTDDTDPDVIAIMLAASSSSARISLTLTRGNNDDVAAAMGRLRWGRPVNKCKRPPAAVETDVNRLINLLNQPVDQISFSMRATNCLQNMGVKYIWQVCECAEAEMLKVKNFGTKSLAEIKEILADMSLSLNMTFSDEVRAQLILPE